MDTRFILEYLTYFIYFPSVLAFLLLGFDKHQAIYGYRRVADIFLLMPIVLMGAFGALCGMIFYNHLTKNKLYLIGVPILLAIQIVAVILMKIFG